MRPSDFAARGTGRVLKVIGFGVALASLGCGAQFAVADDVPSFAPSMITQLTPPVIPRFSPSRAFRDSAAPVTTRPMWATIR
jgi:hypothetical protein